MKLTDQQQNFISTVLGTTSHIALIARAGCGKTSTILVTVDAIVEHQPGAEIIVCAYNKAIKDEVAAKLVQRGHTDWKKVSASTIHGLGFGLVRYVFNNPQVEDKKVLNLLDKQLSWSVQQNTVISQFRQQINQLVHCAKQAGVGFFPDAPIADALVWHQLADHFDIDGLEDADQMERVVAVAQEVYSRSLDQTDVIDYDDMVLFPLIKNLRVKFGKDYLFLDEAQDLSRTRQALAKKFLKPQGRMFVVGDDRQAIYGFSGADADALDNLITSLDAVICPLSITWRCPQAVVREAQRHVPDIVAADTAAEGTVAIIEELPGDLGIGDAILCRATAPLISTAYDLIRKGIAAKVEGRAIGDGLDKLALRWSVKNIDQLLVKLDEYKTRETQKFLALDNPQRAEQVADKCDTLAEICHSCLRAGRRTINDVRAAIAKLFGEDVKGCVVLATYHRSKGREWPRVILLEHGKRCPSRYARQQWQLRQEDNLAYVAKTRAQKTLLYWEPVSTH